MTTKNIFTNINKIESVILDKDGTIIDVHHYWIGMSRLRIQSILNEPAIPSNEHSLKYLGMVLRESNLEFS